jgi:hypothetical protein
MKFSDKIDYLRKAFFIDKNTLRFVEHNVKVWSDWNKGNDSAIVLCDFYGVCETEIARSYFLNVLAKKHGAVIKSFSSLKKVPNIVLKKVYKSFNVSEHIIICLNKEQVRRKNTLYKNIIPIIKTKQDVFNMHALGVWIGIDIYESYLRRFNKPTIFLDDPKLFRLIEEGIGTAVFWQDFFEKNKVSAIVVSHDNYLEFDVICKVAYQKNVPVYLPNIRGLWYVNEPLSVYSCFKDYRKMFNRLSTEERENAINLSKMQLERRFNGEAGVDMPYSTKSGYTPVNENVRVLKDNDKIKVLICSHCFYDNPHGYGGMLFLDFYEWLHFLGRISEKTDYDWYLKVHPDPLPGTEKNIREILADFPKISVIPPDTSHHQLVKEGIKFVLTCYGTVGHEYPALRVQVINAAYNPHIAYDFNWHPKSIKEYEDYLLNLAKLKKDIDLDELYEFYYMHYYYTVADDLVLKSYRKALSELTTDQRIGSDMYGYFLDQLDDGKHEEIIQNMEKFIDSGKSYYFSHDPE